MDYLESFLASLHPSDPAGSAVHEYYEWQMKHRNGDFIPFSDDDVDLRTYFLHLVTIGLDSNALQARADGLNCFYQWAQSHNIITTNPFNEYELLIPDVKVVKADLQPQTLQSDVRELDVERLRALHQIVEQLVSSMNIQSALDSTLRTLLEVMHLQSGWVSMLTESLITLPLTGDPPSHGYILASACNLPPGLESDDRRMLRQPPACRCQALLKEGRLTHPVNIVECSRLQDSKRAAGDNLGLRFHASVPLISKGKPLGLINLATTDWQLFSSEDLHFLSVIASTLVAALERAFFYEAAESRRILLEKELQIASEVQAGLMPKIIPNITGYDLAFSWHPARGIAGDFYDIFPLKDGCWGLLIGDVADKGAAAAMYMAMVHSLILSGTLRSLSPSVVLNEVNQTILHQASSLIYVTVFLAVLDLKHQTLCYANAGHNPPMLRSPSGTIVELRNTGSVLGVFDDLLLTEDFIALGPGDTVLMYTDGVTETWHPGNRDDEYGPDRLAASFMASSGSAGELLSQIENDFHAFTEEAPLWDDVTLIVLKREVIPDDSI